MDGMIHYQRDEDDELKSGLFAESEEGKTVYRESLERVDEDDQEEEDSSTSVYRSSWDEKDGTHQEMDLTITETTEKEGVYDLEWSKDGVTHFMGQAYETDDGDLIGRYESS